MLLARIPHRALIIAVMVLGNACTKKTSDFDTALNAAEAARRDGNFEEERDSFTAADKSASTLEDQTEALYRHAHTWLREGKAERGAEDLEALALSRPHSRRAARCWLDAGRARESLGQKRPAMKNYELVLDKYPDSGGATNAAKRLVDLTTPGASKKEIASTWKRLMDANQSSELDESLRYQYARSLEAVSIKQAILAYESLVTHHPLPGGNLSDDALLRASELRRSVGDFSGALRSLDFLTGHDNSAIFIGNYVRSTYIKALLLRGRILRDDLKDPDLSRSSFLLLTKRYPDSILVDDALWEVVITSYRFEGKAQACLDLENLKKLSPNSRFLKCEALLCKRQIPPEFQRRNACENELKGPR